MVNITIYSKNGLEKATVKSLEYDGTFMGDRYVTVSVSSPTVINWAIGDYLEYRGERWSLWLLPATSKVARANTYGGAFEYKDLRFCPTEEELRRCSFLDVVLSDNEIHYTSLPNFSFYCATAKDLADRIQANLDRLYPGAWTITANPAASITDQSLTFTNNSCWDALTMANSSLDLNFTIDSANRSIVIGGEGAFIETVMDYGQGHGLKSIERTVDSNQQVINRLYAYGNTRNLPYRYYNKRYGADSPIFDEVQSMYLPNLMLPGICKGWGASEAASHLDANGNVKEAYGSEGQALTYNHSTFWYDNPDGSRYVGTVYLFYRHFSLNEDRTTYYCDRVWIESESSINKCGIQEGVKFFDGSDELVDDIYPSITGFDSTEALAEAVGSAIAAEQNLNFEQGELDEVLGFTVDSWDGIIPEEQETTPTFYIRIKNIGFDMSDAELDASGDTPRLSMKSGMCTGREFNILECKKQVFAYGSWQDYNPSAPVSGPWSYRLKCEVAADESIGQYFPNRNFTLAVGDKFVILGIKMPDIYVDVAERRLLKSAIIWLSENDKTAYNYSPAINNIYMSENPETSSLLKEGNVLHIYDADLDINVEMTISQLKIKNDKQIPEYEVTLSNDKEADLVQRITAQVHQSFTQFIGNGKGGGSNIYLIGTTSTVAPTDNNAYSARRSLQMFLRKDIDDIAAGKITFNDLSTFLGGANYGVYEPGGFLGAGAHVGADGRGEFEEITVRGALRAAELVFNRISAEEGEAIRSIGHGEILSVDESSLTATLKLEGDEWATIDVGDICRGLYNTIDKDYDNADSEGEDANGFRNKPGFFASYFKVEEILESGKGECSFRYSLQPGTTEHPCELMKFAVYGNTDNTKKERQSCMYITAVGIAPRTLFLANVNDWKIKPQNIKIAQGNIEGLQVYEKQSDGSVVPKTLHGDAGLFVEDNIYFGGILQQFTAADWEYIQEHVGQGIHAELTRGSDNIVVDALGNIVNGIYEQYEGGNRHYRLHTGVLVYDSGKKRYLTLDEFAIYYNCEGCDVLRDGADFYVTNIHNTNDGLDSSTLTDEELELMRNTDECKVNFTIVTNSGWRTIISYPIRVTHLDHGYITFDLDNEYDSVAYRTQTKKYDGLPVETHIRAYVNGEEVQVVSTSVKTNFTTSDLSEETISADGNIAQTRYFRNNSASGIKMELTKAGKLTLKVYTKSSDDIDFDDAFYYFDIKCSVKYAGVVYESSWKRFTLTETTDSTLYKLLLSANAISKEEGTYTPSSIDTKVQIIDNTGTQVKTENELEASGSIKVRYLSGTYNPSDSVATLTQSWLTPANKPAFSDVDSCFTVLVADLSNPSSPVVLDVESVTINAVGRDGAGQPYVRTNLNQIVIDCDADGKILTTTPITLRCALKYGDQICTIQANDSEITLGGVSVSSTVSGNDLVHDHTFTQGDVLSSTQFGVALQGTYQGETHSAALTIPVLALKKGGKGDKGDTGAALRLRGNYLIEVDTDPENGYVWNSTFRDAVKGNGEYWFVNVPSDGTEPLGTPSQNNNKWMQVSNFKMVATELLLADNAAINLLSSQVINMFNASGVKTASINADGNGEYCIHYPTGGKCLTFSYDKYIHCYREDGSEAWRIGLGGDIEKFISADFINFPLCSLSGRSGAISQSDTFAMTNTYWRYRSGNSSGLAQYDGKIYNSGSATVAPTNPATATAITDGRYTPDTRPHQVVDSMETDRYAIIVYVVEGGFIKQTLELTEL